MTGEPGHRTQLAWFESFPESVFIMDPEGAILDANSVFASRFQKPLQECIGTNIYSLLAPEIASLRREKAEEALRTGKQISWEDERNSRILRNTIYPTLSPEGKVSQLLIFQQDVTEVKLRELSLKNEQTISKTIIDTIPGTFYILDANGQYVGWNSYQREEIAGKTELEMGSFHAIETIHPDDQQIVAESMRDILTLGTEVTGEGRVLLRGGPEFRWLLMTGKRFIINGKPFVVGMGIDITERKQTEQALQENEERFRKLFESHSAIQLILDPETGYIIDANQAAEDFYGWSIEELKQIRLHEINTLPPDEVRLILNKWMESKQLNVSFRHLRADGSVRDVEVFANKVEIKGKALIYCIIHDINQRKHFEALSAFRLTLLEMAEAHSVETILLAAINEAERLTASAIGFCHFIENIFPASTIQVMSSNMQKNAHRVMATSQTHPSLNDAEFWVDAMREKKAIINNNYDSSAFKGDLPHGHPFIRRTLLVPLLQGDRVVAILVVVNKPSDYDDDDVRWVNMLASIAWDIVAKKLADEEREKLQCQLQHFQKMEVVGQLAGGIAHDFNNMLAVILGHAEMTLELLDPEQPIFDNLEIIHKAASHSADLTHQLLAFARKQTVISRILKINSIVEEMLPMLRRLVGENITLIWKPETRLLQVKIDPAQIDQILANLCINARDAINGTGQITIETSLLHIDTIEGAIIPPYLAPGNYVTLTVSDDGSGIEKKDLPHIFEPFFTTKEIGKGTGMGLSTVYGIVKQNNGSIECESNIGKGTSFRISLPLHNESTDTNGDELETEPEKSGGTETILLVEDEHDILKLCKLMLESRGYNVLSTATPSEAIKITKRHKGNINLLLTDVIMPEMNGNELSKKLQSIQPNLKTLFMSGYTTEIVSHQKRANNDVAFIQKPFSLNTLIKAVHESLNN
jgi:two-component system, cell cycle sensor histidine kinase and response regulator CckA